MTIEMRKAGIAAKGILILFDAWPTQVHTGVRRPFRATLPTRCIQHECTGDKPATIGTDIEVNLTDS
jgi:hypothetical protein